jgi:outer membrane protein TolC
MSRAWLLLAASSLAVGACAVGPDFKPPETHAAPTYSAPYDAPPPADQQVVLGEKIAGDWWAQFRSPALDRLIRLAIADNQDIAAARTRVAQAQ